MSQFPVKNIFMKHEPETAWSLTNCRQKFFDISNNFYKLNFDNGIEIIA